MSPIDTHDADRVAATRDLIRATHTPEQQRVHDEATRGGASCPTCAVAPRTGAPVLPDCPTMPEAEAARVDALANVLAPHLPVPDSTVAGLATTLARAALAHLDTTEPRTTLRRPVCLPCVAGNLEAHTPADPACAFHPAPA